MRHTSRRSFLRRAGLGTAVLTFGGTAPAVLEAAARSSREERILVVIELAGGNDGLNTVVPFRNDEYRHLRPVLALPADQVLGITNELGFHPALRGLADLLEAGQLAVVQGVGYDNPNRSHFESMDIWHTCQRTEENRTDGWLGRYLARDGAPGGDDPAGMHLGEEKQPLALLSREIPVPTIRSLSQFRLAGAEHTELHAAIRELTETGRGNDNDLLAFVQSGTRSALRASERIGAASPAWVPTRAYPETPLAGKLQTIARLIHAGLQTRVYYVQLDGYDTHAQQADAHAGLLRQLGDAVRAFLSDMVAQEHGERLLVMCFSEFGRRVAENASEGTDHGTAGPVFLAGPGVRAGLVGAHPRLDDLTDGDLRHHTDFRQVYASVLQDWMGCDPRTILRGEFRPVPAIADTSDSRG